MKIGLSGHFKKRAKRLSSKEKELLDERTMIFQENSSDFRLKNHALTGKLKGCFAFSITLKKRVKYIFIDNETVLFIDVGSHDDVY